MPGVMLEPHLPPTPEADRRIEAPTPPSARPRVKRTYNSAGPSPVPPTQGSLALLACSSPSPLDDGTSAPLLRECIAAERLDKPHQPTGEDPPSPQVTPPDPLLPKRLLVASAPAALSPMIIPSSSSCQNECVSNSASGRLPRRNLRGRKVCVLSATARRLMTIDAPGLGGVRGSPTSIAATCDGRRHRRGGPPSADDKEKEASEA
eukprot:scaffold43322_cov28-Tisochrysis_lutea.AAC.8